MADNNTLDNGALTDIAIATDKATYSGDASQDVQLIRQVHIAGSEGSKTVEEVTKTIAAAVPAAAVMVGGTDGTNARHLKTDTSGELQIDVLTVPADPFGANADASSATGSISAKLKYLASAFKAEDSGHTTADIGAFILAIRNDANATLTNTDLDYTGISTDLAGNLNAMLRRPTTRISVQSAGLTTTATAYTAGDQLGNQMTFAGCARASGGSGVIVGALLISAADTIGAVDLAITRSSITLASDNAAGAISDADALNLVGYVQLAGAFDIGNNRIAFATNLAIPYDCAATSLFVGMITRSAIAATPFAAGTDIQLILFVEPN